MPLTSSFGSGTAQHVVSENVQLAGGSGAPAAARRAVDRLAGRIDDDLLQSVRLLVSELVANSVRHAGVGPEQVVKLSISLSDAWLHVSVTDPGGSKFERAETPTDAPCSGGWGLRLVEAVADGWGVAATTDGETRIWFEIARTPGRGA